MEFGVFIPIVAIIASAWVIVAAVKIRHGRGNSGSGTAMSVGEARENVQLARENEDLKLTIERLEDRLGVLERIATDPAERTAREIERLR
jgi:hypothetical protein